MRKELYAVPVTIGCVLYMSLLNLLAEYVLPIGVGCALFTFTIRAAAIYWNLSVPSWMLLQAKTDKWRKAH